jgi:hypothetical protein
MKPYMRCENCDSTIKPEVYEANEGLCKKCLSRQYPANCFDPRKDMKSWWTDAGVPVKTPAKMSPVKYGFARGRLAAE